MKPRFLVATIVVGVLTAACAESSSITQPGGGAIDHATGAADLVLRVQTGGGFIDPASTLNQLPSFSLYGDGTVLQPGAQIQIYPGPALTEPIATPITEAGIQAILRDAAAAGLFQSRDFTNLGSVGIADAATTTFTITVNGTTSVTHVYALGGQQQQPQGMTDVEFQARTALAAFEGKLVDLKSWLPQGSVGPDGQFVPQALAVYVSAYRPDQSLHEPAALWPLSTPLSSFGTPLQVPAGFSCEAVGGNDIATLLPLAERANQLTPWESGGERFGLTFRPLLPDQTEC